VLPNLHKLVYRTHAAHAHIIAQHHVAGQLGIVADGAVVANNAIVRNMAIRQYPAIVAYLGNVAIAGAAVDGYKLSDGAIVANFYACFFAFVLAVLGYAANNRTGKNAAILTDAGAFHNGNIAANKRTITNFYIAMYHRKRIHLYRLGQIGVGVYVGKRMYHAEVLFLFCIVGLQIP